MAERAGTRDKSTDLQYIHTIKQTSYKHQNIACTNKTQHSDKETRMTCMSLQYLSKLGIRYSKCSCLHGLSLIVHFVLLLH